MPQRLSIRIVTLSLALTSAITGCHKQPKPQPIVPPPSFPESAMIVFPEPLPPPGVAAAPPPQPNPAGKTQAHTTRPRPRNHSTEKKPPVTTNGNDTVVRN